jgi:hypothetical protein
LEPLNLAEHQQVRISVNSLAVDAAQIAAIQRRAMEELDADMDALPDHSPDDGFTAADHDKLLYGGSS